MILAIMRASQSTLSELVLAAMVTALGVIVDLVVVAMPLPLRPIVVTVVPPLLQPRRLRSCQQGVHESLACIKPSSDLSLNQCLFPDITWLWSLSRASFQWAFLPLASCLHAGFLQTSPRLLPDFPQTSPRLSPGFSPAFTLISDPATGTPPYAGTCPALPQLILSQTAVSDPLDKAITTSVCQT